MGWRWEGKKIWAERVRLRVVDIGIQMQWDLVYDIQKFVQKTMEAMSHCQVPNLDESGSLQTAGFITKTFEILCNTDYSKIIFWAPSGKEFVIRDINKFQEIVLPKYFRHSKINSFIRQLNMYGFHKSRKDTSKSIFSHPCFQKERQDLLPLIKRKVKNNEKPLKTPVKKNINALQNTSKTKIQTEEKKAKDQIDYMPFKSMQQIESRILLDSQIHLSIPLSIASIGDSLAQAFINNKCGDDVSIENDIQRDEEKQNIKIINPSMFISSFNDIK